MPLANAVLLGTNATSAVTITVSPSRDIQVGEFITVTMTHRDTIVSLSDNSAQAGAANSYSQDRAQTGDPFCYIYSCKVTRKILTSDTITGTFLSGALTSICVLALPDANASSQLDKVASQEVTGGSSTYTSTAVAATAQDDEYAIGVAVFALASTGAPTTTADAPWVLHYSPAAGGAYGTSHGSRVLTAIGTPAYSGSWGVTQDGDYVAAIATYKGTVPGAQNQLAWIVA